MSSPRGESRFRPVLITVATGLLSVPLIIAELQGDTSSGELALDISA